MKENRYILEKYTGLKSRYTCPGCGKHKTFTRYVNAQTGEYMPENIGRCDREVNCGYHVTPKQHFENTGAFNQPYKRNYIKPVTKAMSLIPVELFKKSLAGYETNHLVTFLANKFGSATATKLIEQYYIGTSNHWPGATVFHQIDLNGNIRAAKIMLYSPETGKRVKNPFNYITWGHTALKLEEFNLVQCFFGEHLLTDKSAPVAIVESEKTALIASAFMPEFIWLACGSLQGLNEAKFKALKGRSVILWPDLNGYEKWQVKMNELKGIVNLKLSYYLEEVATPEDRKQGKDLADYLLEL